jgi:ribonuclease BN (tRNA processing enzyme)
MKVLDEKRVKTGSKKDIRKLFRFAYKSALSAAAVLSMTINAQSASLEAQHTQPASDNLRHTGCHDVSVQVLGSGGPELDDGRSSSAYIVWVEQSAKILIDAGSGSSIQFGAAGASFTSLEAILLSHLHTDHAVDLPSFIKGGYFTNRTDDLLVLGPDGNNVMPSTEAYVLSYTEKGQDDYTVFSHSVANASLHKPFERRVNESVSVEAMSVNHGPIPALAWKVKANGCEVVFSGDTNDQQGQLAGFANNADLLVLHNAIDDHAGRVAKNLHMTPNQIIEIAKQSKAKQVLLSHIMKRSEPGLDALTEAITVVAPGRVYAAEELMNITLGDEN